MHMYVGLQGLQRLQLANRLVGDGVRAWVRNPAGLAALARKSA